LTKTWVAFQSIQPYKILEKEVVDAYAEDNLVLVCLRKIYLSSEGKEERDMEGRTTFPDVVDLRPGSPYPLAVPGVGSAGRMTIASFGLPGSTYDFS
jgi:hypothetical protein